MGSIFDTVLGSLERAGYNNYWQLMNCADYEIPQSRERVLIISIRKDQDDGRFHFPAPVPLTTCMNDFLDDAVPERFYLSDERVQKVIRCNSAHAGQMCDRNGNSKVVTCRMEIKQVADLNHYRNDQMNRIYSPDGLCPTLKTVSGGGREIKIYNGAQYRNLTPKEYFRLMGFTDKDVELLESNGFSKTQLYRMAGNSIPVKMLEHLFTTLYERGD